MIKTVFLPVLLLVALFAKAQQNQQIKIGQVVFDENIQISNDSVSKSYFVTEKGYCYAIRAKFKNKRPSDIDAVKSQIKTNDSWVVVSTRPKDNYIKYLCEVVDNSSRYSIYYEGLDVDEVGLVLLEESKDSVPENYGYPANDWHKAESLEKFFASQTYLNRHAALILKNKEEEETRMQEKLEYENQLKENEQKEIQEEREIANRNAIPLGAIALPYKFRFGMNETELENHLKSLLDKNSSYTVSKNLSNSDEEKLAGVKHVTFRVKSNGANSFTVGMKLYKGKAYDYQYEHGYELDKKLREKIADLVADYERLDTRFGNEIFVKQVVQDIREAKYNYDHRGDGIGKKM